jgi:hypothetical protein
MNLEIMEDYSSNLESASVQSQNLNDDKFICLTKDGQFSAEMINIYFKFDYNDNKKWLVNVEPLHTLEELTRKITQLLSEEFDEFKDLSGLRISEIQ